VLGSAGTTVGRYGESLYACPRGRAGAPAGAACAGSKVRLSECLPSLSWRARGCAVRFCVLPRALLTAADAAQLLMTLRRAVAAGLLLDDRATRVLLRMRQDVYVYQVLTPASARIRDHPVPKRLCEELQILCRQRFFLGLALAMPSMMLLSDQLTMRETRPRIMKSPARSTSTVV
jgi:hypothetical protein